MTDLPDVKKLKQVAASAPRLQAAISNEKAQLRTNRIIPTHKDVVFGRGYNGNEHPANIELREEAELWKVAHENDKDKQRFAKHLVSVVRGWGGRFLKKRDGAWENVGYGKEAMVKCQKLLREKKPLTQRPGGSFRKHW